MLTELNSSIGDPFLEQDADAQSPVMILRGAAFRIAWRFPRRPDRERVFHVKHESFGRGHPGTHGLQIGPPTGAYVRLRDTDCAMARQRAPSKSSESADCRAGRAVALYFPSRHVSSVVAVVAHPSSGRHEAEVHSATCVWHSPRSAPS